VERNENSLIMSYTSSVSFTSQWTPKSE